MNDVANTLRLAGEYMDKHGKAEGTFCDTEGRVCMVGALQQLLSQHIISCQEYENAMECLAAELSPLGLTDRVYLFSDHNHQEVVVKKFYEIAAKVEFVG